MGYETLLLAALGSMLIGLLLTLFGGGGSVLATPWLIYVVGLTDTHAAIGTSAAAVAAVAVNASASSLVSVSLFGGATSLSYAASGQLIWPLFGALVVGGTGGILAALPLAKYLESRSATARTVFALMVIAVALFILLD